MLIDFSSLDVIEISDETKKLWQEAIEDGIAFEIQESRNVVLKIDFDNMRFPADQTYRELQYKKASYEALIKQHNGEFLKLILLRTRLEQLLEILDTYEVDETNADLLEKCFEALGKKLQT